MSAGFLPSQNDHLPRLWTEIILLFPAPSLCKALLRPTYRDEVVFREAAGLNVVLQQLLGEVLVHLGSFVSIDGIATCLVQIFQHRETKKGAATIATELPLTRPTPRIPS